MNIHHLHGQFDGLSGRLGLGLFCQIVDGGDGGDFGLLLGVEFAGAKGAIGLEDAEFGDAF